MLKLRPTIFRRLFRLRFPFHFQNLEGSVNINKITRAYTCKIMSLDKSNKKTVDPFMLFSIGKKNDIDKISCPNILVNGSSDEETEDGHTLENENVAKKLSFNCSDANESNSKRSEKSFLGNHEVFLLPSDYSEVSNDEDDEGEKAEKGLETLLIEENEKITPAKLKVEPISQKSQASYRRIVRMASSSSSSSESEEASFDLGNY